VQDSAVVNFAFFLQSISPNCCAIVVKVWELDGSDKISLL
jgi:hypothetical protein